MESLKDLLIDEMKDLYSAEKQLVRALPKMEKAAKNQNLKAAFASHLEETRTHVERLERAFEMLGQKPKAKTCKAMQGLIEEGGETMKEDGDRTILDLAIVGAAQRVEHYEISAYGTVRAIARQLDRKDVADLITGTLEEEAGADKKLTQIARELYGAVGNSRAKSASQG